MGGKFMSLLKSYRKISNHEKDNTIEFIVDHIGIVLTG